MVRVEEVIRRSAQGVLRPFLCRGSDRQLYYVKGHGAGPRSMICEYLCAHLGAQLELPIPRFEVLEVPARLVEASDLEGIEDLGGGLAFGSQQVSETLELSLSRVKRVPEELRRKVLAFDWWIQNEDRYLTERGGNPNLLWQVEGGGLVVFDHNMAFDPEFSVQCFREGHAFAGVLSAFAEPDFQEQMSEKLLTAAGHLDQILQGCPEEWLEQATNFDIDTIRRILNRPHSPEFWRLEP